MPTNKPRITITLEPHTHAVLTELSRLQGKSKSGIITEFLETVVPVLERTCYLLQLAQSATATVNDDLKASMERAEATLFKMFNDAMGEMDGVTELLSRGVDESSAKVGGDTGAESRSRASLPPHSNTGVDFGDKSENPTKNND